VGYDKLDLHAGKPAGVGQRKFPISVREVDQHGLISSWSCRRAITMNCKSTTPTLKRSRNSCYALGARHRGDPVHRAGARAGSDRCGPASKELRQHNHR
jgi:hypothetical protein